MPVAAVGAEECYDILVDSDEMRHSPLGPVLEWLTDRADGMPPLVAGIGPLPRPQRFYFRFAAPIDTQRWAGRAHDQAACLELRAEVARAIERGIKTLLRERRRDPEAKPAARLARRFGAATTTRRSAIQHAAKRRRRSRPG